MPVLILCAVFIAQTAQACSFHFYKPERSVIDRVLDSDTLAIARPHPDSPFSFQIVEVLRGAENGVAIRELVNSQIRARLAANPDDGVLFVFDQETNVWQSIAYLSGDYRQVVDFALAHEEAWRTEYTPDRLALFAGLQTHPEPALRQLALLEIDKAPYDMLRGIELQIPAEKLLAELWKIEGYPYQSIRILLLGLSDDDAARREIRAFIARAPDRERSRNLGAFATALVEIDGDAGIALLDREILSDPRQSRDNVEQVVEALAIHSGVGAPGMAASIAATLDRLVALRPDTAALIARQFGSRQNWTQADRLAPLVAERRLTAASDLMTVAVYLAQARDAHAAPPTGTGMGD
ncbi:hypothetical protein R5H30_12755 [Sulfitobacter sp. D35]|uniref:hypothetical protein n=1 Tax=Sulfitobacter sp. D35 TaxID=3083252 RepID=UPI00296E2F3F|nr:hypothetical protein [Sulfitobacter sp. D35]MDW4498858.1 hypothetical protein [Sulfitobacter sp. D35]